MASIIDVACEECRASILMFRSVCLGSPVVWAPIICLNPLNCRDQEGVVAGCAPGELPGAYDLDGFLPTQLLEETTPTTTEGTHSGVPTHLHNPLVPGVTQDKSVAVQYKMIKINGKKQKIKKNATKPLIFKPEYLSKLRSLNTKENIAIEASVHGST